MTPADIEGVVALQRACFPPPFPEEYLWTAEHLLAHLAKFPEGQFVAVRVNSSPREGEVATRPAATEGVAPLEENNPHPVRTSPTSPCKQGEVTPSLPSPWGGGGFEGASASEKTGAGTHATPSPCPLPLGSGREGVLNSSPREGEVSARPAATEGVGNFEGNTPPPSSPSASLPRIHLLPKEEDLQLQSPSLGEGVARYEPGAGFDSSSELSSIHPPLPGPLPQGEGAISETQKGEAVIVASASTSRISEAQWQAHLPWEETLGGFTFDRYDPEGTTLYAADISVHPNYRGHGIARKLYQARFDLCRQLGCERVGTACRIPDYHRFEGTQEQYVARVDVGGLTDRTLTPLLKCGMELSGVIHDYMDDPESGNAAALLEWRP